MATLPVALLLIYNLLILLGEVTPGKQKGSATLLLVLFFCSGMPALTYQIVWQRALFTIYGVNSESVAVVVSAFMIGLGLGSLLGGWLSARFPRSGVFLFAIAELGTAVFGLMSLGIFHWAAEHTAGASLGYVVILSLGLLLVPTVCMGATLPLLTDFLVRRRGEVGSSVGVLYFANTFGSAVACYLSAVFLPRDFGQSGAVRLAALTNISVGLAALFLARSRGAQPLTTAIPGSEVSSFFSLRMATILSFLTAFVSLGFEIVCFRVLVIASGSRAPAFALLLATFLAGIAAGAFVSGKSSERESAPATAAGMSMALLVAGGVAPILLPKKDRWMEILYSYKIDGRPSFDTSDKETQAFIEKYAGLGDSLDHDATSYGMENAESMRKRIKTPLFSPTTTWVGNGASDSTFDISNAKAGCCLEVGSRTLGGRNTQGLTKGCFRFADQFCM
jgi:MFS family permease